MTTPRGLRGLPARVALFEFRRQRAEFYRDFAEMFRRNEAMVSFLEGEIANAQATRQRSREHALRLVLMRHRRGDNASSVSTLLEGVVPAGDAMLLLAVDRAGDKAEALLALAEAIDKQQQMTRLMTQYAVLPAITIPICHVLIALLSQVILAVDKSTPDFVQDALWSGLNGWARVIARVASVYGLPVLAIAAAGLAAVVWSLPRWKGPGRLRVEGWPVFGLYRDFQAGMLFCSMAMMLKTGETLPGSLEDIAQRSSAWMRWHLGRVLAALDENPTGTIDAFRRGLLSPYLLSRAATLQRSSASFSDVLIQLGTREGERVLQRVKRAAVIANLALVGCFASVATFMGVASMTVPATFANLMEPSTLMSLKSQYEATHPQAGANDRSTTPEE
jgi:type II secretory pathway component PulF